MAERLEQLVAALEKAHAAGDEQAARAIAEAIKRERQLTLPPPEQSPAETAPAQPHTEAETPRWRFPIKLSGEAEGVDYDAYRSPLGGMVDVFRQGLSGGSMDEISAGLKAAVQAPFSERTFGEIYDEERARQLANLEKTRAEHPVLSTGVELAGAALPTSRIAGLVGAVGRNLPTWVKAAVTAGTEGAIYGAGTAGEPPPSADGGEPQQESGSRLLGAATGGMIGAVAGPLVSTISKPVITGARNLATVVGRKLTETPERQAERLVADALRNDQITPADAERLLANPNLVLADLGENVAGLARGAQARLGPFRADAARVLRERQAGQQERLMEAAGIGDQPTKGTPSTAMRQPIQGMPSESRRQFKDAFDDWMDSRIKDADKFYAEARQTPLDLTSPQLQSIVRRLDAAGALKAGQQKIAIEGRSYGHLDLLDAAKRALDDDIGAALRAGKNDEARSLLALKRDLLQELDKQVPAYRKARETFAGEAAVRNAAELGERLFSRSVSHDEARRLVSEMTQSELDAFRRGAIRGLVDLLERTPENRNAAQKLVESVAMRDKVRLMFPNAADFERFMQQAADEARMSYTRNVVLGGSPTARIQEESRVLSSAGEILRDAITGNHLGLFGRFLRALGYGDVSEETLNALSRLLLTNPGQQTVQRIASQAAKPLPGPISPSTQVNIGGIVGAVSGMQPGRGGSTEKQPPTNNLRQRLLAQGLGGQ